jgi:cold shock CspA family protein
MGRSQESFQKKEVRKKKEKKRKEKEKRRLLRKESEKSSTLDDMIAYVDEKGMITSTPPDPVNKEEIDPEGIEVSVPKRTPGEDTDAEREGKVTFFDKKKGYGFIKDSETQENVFVHINDLLADIDQGSKVSYRLTKGKKGLAATQVKLTQ